MSSWSVIFIAMGPAKLQPLREFGSEADFFKSSQVNTLPKAKSGTRSKQNKDMHKYSSVYSERRVPLPVLTSGGE
jgi:hypothetical protein